MRQTDLDYQEESASRACWVITSRSRSLFQSKLAQGLRGSLRSSTAKRPSIARDDLYTGDFPSNTSESSRPRRRREFQTTSSKRRPRGASSSEAIPHLRNRPSDISDLTTRFPQPPSHIPLSLAQLNDSRRFSRPPPLVQQESHRPSQNIFKGFFRKLTKKFSRKQQSSPVPQARIYEEFVDPSQLRDSPSPKPKYAATLGENHSFAIHSTLPPPGLTGGRVPRPNKLHISPIPPASPLLAPPSPLLAEKRSSTPSSSRAHRKYRPPTPPKGVQRHIRTPSASGKPTFGVPDSPRPTFHQHSHSSPQPTSPPQHLHSSSTTPLSYASLPRQAEDSGFVYPSQTESQHTNIPISQSYQPTALSFEANMNFGHPMGSHSPPMHAHPSMSMDPQSPMGHRSPPLHRHQSPMDHPSMSHSPPMDHEHTPMDYSGKRTDVVDAGGEFDYSGMQWFTDRPERPPPPPTQPPAEAYVPPPNVIEQNESFQFALSISTNELYARYKQYGQLGVLAWISEFSELIDNLKELGFKGNMFVSTRSQALKACEDLLRLKLDVKMQIIVMYLSAQVARLRRFLDGDKQWDDYPTPQFPVDPSQYT
ncbi:hypothetical protein Agabi119p4_195 [Agaricus bisporus var. burnettii]|uniref:Uncharacterized protein n=2 Tax=Agaricus bisporus var. burnettii TaxID=192524 RepID=A0A8H7KKL4_AGABI|nr:hypothetical protein Agabi119p4_195 [Agaricus bisporus var. burnettii]